MRTTLSPCTPRTGFTICPDISHDVDEHVTTRMDGISNNKEGPRVPCGVGHGELWIREVGRPQPADQVEVTEVLGREA
jgi:hypothetical protein